jgi:hypothetical protein
LWLRIMHIIPWKGKTKSKRKLSKSLTLSISTRTINWLIANIRTLKCAKKKLMKKKKLKMK